MNAVGDRQGHDQGWQNRGDRTDGPANQVQKSQGPDQADADVDHGQQNRPAIAQRQADQDNQQGEGQRHEHHQVTVHEAAQIDIGRQPTGNVTFKTRPGRLQVPKIFFDPVHKLFIKCGVLRLAFRTHKKQGGRGRYD